MELDSRAADAGCFIEVVVLSAAVIDGMLRIGLILKHQLDASVTEVLPELLYQGDADKAIPERLIYDRARDASIITSELHVTLNRLYDDRNRVVHRYVISSITTQDVLDIALRYEAAKREVTEAVSVLEAEQIRRGIGMTREGGTPDLVSPLDFAAVKHGSDDLTRELRRQR